MSIAISEKGRRTFTAPTSKSCLKSHERSTSIIFECDLMLNHLMLATLDAETQREWELITASRANTPMTTELVTFLEARCRALELLQNIESLKTTPTQRQRQEYAAPRADHDCAGPQYWYLDWYATANTAYVDYGTKNIQVTHYGI